MSWIQTYTGKQFFPLEPRADDIDIRDIARSLSLLCRFNGHCKVFYSVAEHSVRVSNFLPRKLALWGLLHDAGEAYLSDLPRPIKAAIPEFSRIEERLLGVVADAFELSWPMPPEVKEADDILLATEARDLMVTPPASWELTSAPLEETIVPASPDDAMSYFLALFETLSK